MLANNKKTIWIDLDNSPHVPFFKPIIDELDNKGYKIFITARDCFQVCGLADLYHIQYKRVGRHYGKMKLLKVVGTLIRAMQLLPIAIKEKPVFSISHGSRSQLIVSYLLRIPKMIIFDYEYAKGLGIIRPKWNLGPEIIPKRKNGFKPENCLRYPGLKEDVYVSSYEPKKGFRQELGIGDSEILVTIRPPATEAHYHNPESEKLFTNVLQHLGGYENLRMLILPRNEIKQKNYIIEMWRDWYENGKILIPEHVLNGLDVIWNSDFVISGGGTMNREAAAMGVPVYSIFRGKIGDVDKYLSLKNRLVLIESEVDVKEKIFVSKRNISFGISHKNKNTLDTILSHIVTILESL